MVEAPATTRRERRKQEVHARILDAAVELFDQGGFDGTPVAAICERADVAHKTFFNHFPSKLHLLRAIASDALDQLLLDIEEVRKEIAPTRERLHGLFQRIADNADEAGPMHRELLTEIIHAGHEAGTEREHARKLHDAFGVLVREGRAAGDVSEAHGVETQTDMVIGAFYALMFNWVNLEGYPLRRQALAAASFLGDALCEATEGVTS